MWMSQEELWRRAEASDLQAARDATKRRLREQLEATEQRSLNAEFERLVSRRRARAGGSSGVTERRRVQDLYDLSDAELRSRFNLGPGEILRPGTRAWDSAWKLIDPRGRVGTAVERWTGPFDRR
jgi:hypothetical protein